MKYPALTLWITGDDGDDWAEAARVMLSRHTTVRRVAHLDDVTIKAHGDHQSTLPSCHVVLWAGDDRGVGDFCGWLRKHPPRRSGRTYVAAGRWSGAEQSALQRFGVRGFVNRWTDLVATEQAILRHEIRRQVVR